VSSLTTRDSGKRWAETLWLPSLSFLEAGNLDCSGTKPISHAARCSQVGAARAHVSDMVSLESGYAAAWCCRPTFAVPRSWSRWATASTRCAGPAHALRHGGGQSGAGSGTTASARLQHQGQSGPPAPCICLFLLHLLQLKSSALAAPTAPVAVPRDCGPSCCTCPAGLRPDTAGGFDSARLPRF